jgi:hypothetical protein
MNMIDRFRDASRGLLAILGLAAVALSVAAAPVASAQSREADSDDYNCNHGAPDDPTTIEACNRLRGTARGAGVDVGHQYNSDDYNCNHGDPNDAATLTACQHLRGTTYGVGADEGHQRNSDDYNCNHGAPDDPATAVACRHLHGYAAASAGGGAFVTVHVVRDFGSTRYVGRRAYRSVREAVEFSCAAGERRRAGYVFYAGRGATGARVSVSHGVSAWRRVPRSAMPNACR